jgi:hypothetical protein
MALASLILSFFSLIVPFGIAALDWDTCPAIELQRVEAALRGRWFAFAGLMIGDIQVPVGALLFLGVAAPAFRKPSAARAVSRTVRA